jgi:hypothetical protein
MLNSFSKPAEFMETSKYCLEIDHSRRIPGLWVKLETLTSKDHHFDALIELKNPVLVARSVSRFLGLFCHFSTYINLCTSANR